GRIRPIVRAEHERWDGAGYPDGLRGRKIPIEARIIHACDAFQAMSSDRPYRRARPRDWILKEIHAQSGRQFDPSVAEALIQVGEGITGWVAETKQGALVGDTERHPKGIHIPGTSESNESMLAVPVIFEDRLIGVIVNVKVGINQYTGDHLRLLTILANHAAVSIFNARLIERLAASARTDPLTGLANRRAFEQALEQRLAAAAPETFAVLMLDVDGLKQVNAARGHAAVDGR